MITIPPEEFHPPGFKSNGVTGWFDKWLVRSDTTFFFLDAYAAAWWHDLWYYLGFFVPMSTPWEEIRKLRPRDFKGRNRIQRWVIDAHFRVSLRDLGFPQWRSKAAWKVVRRLGAPHYYLGKDWEIDASWVPSV